MYSCRPKKGERNVRTRPREVALAGQGRAGRGCRKRSEGGEWEVGGLEAYNETEAPLYLASAVSQLTEAVLEVFERRSRWQIPNVNLITINR